MNAALVAFDCKSIFQFKRTTALFLIGVFWTMLLLSLLSVSSSVWPHEVSFTISQSLLKLMSIESVMPPTISSTVTPFSSCPQSLPASGSFPESALNTRWIRYCSFTYSISPANAYSGFISFRIDWFDLLAVQGTLKSLILHHNSKASIFLSFLFFFFFFVLSLLQHSHPYMTTGKIIALTIGTFVGKVMYLLFNTLSRFVIAFLPRSKLLLILWLHSSSIVLLEPTKIKSLAISTSP